MGEMHSWVKQPPSLEPSASTTVGMWGWRLDPGDVHQLGKQARVVSLFNFARVAINLHFVSQFFKFLETFLDS